MGSIQSEIPFGKLSKYLRILLEPTIFFVQVKHPFRLQRCVMDKLTLSINAAYLSLDFLLREMDKMFD